MNTLLGNFPASKFKRHFEITLGKMLQPKAKGEHDREQPYLRAANVQNGQVTLKDVKTMWFSLRETHKLSLKRGDLLVLEGGDSGRSAILNCEYQGLKFQNSLHRLRGSALGNNRFAHYWLIHLKGSGYFDLICSKSTLTHFTSEKFKETPFPAISLSTQRTIADFLDRETARIDQLIQKKQRLVELLEEKAQSFAEKALESLEQNDCLNAKLAFFVTKVGSGKTPRGGAETYVDSGVAFLRSQNVHNDGLRLDQVAYIDHEVDEEMKNTRVRKGDVLLNITGGSLGRCSVATINDLPANVS
jgi:type I restriction enzyme S subunit